MSTWREQRTLTGKHVRLEPLTLSHAPDLLAAGADPDVWTWLSSTRPTTVPGMEALITKALADPGRLAFAQICAGTGEAAGTTSYYDIDEQHRGLAIGHTWIGARWHRTGLNTEAKLLLLSHAFDHLGAIRVAWHTDHRNERSQRAIERLGARREGVLRSHRIRPDGTIRDTVTYSVTAEEWPATRLALTAKLR